VTASTSGVSNRFTFTARERDPETKLYYYRARYYDPLFGRFLSEDEMALGDGSNAYPYVANRPTILSDPLGMYKILGFPPGRSTQMEEAIAEVKAKLSSSCCAGTDTADLLRRLQNATFVYKPGSKWCGEVGPLSDFLRIRNNVGIGPRAFDYAQCEKLACSVLHEVSHLRVRRGVEDVAYKLEKDCFGCGTGKKPSNKYPGEE
jgi:RHS repeat-associated protein